MQYLFPYSEMLQKEKHQIQLHIPDLQRNDVNVVHVECERGHFQEFQMKSTTFIYTIIEGTGVFFIDDQPFVAGKGDMVIIPPEHKTWYAGKMNMILSSSPAYTPEDEMHIRLIEEDEMEKAWEKYLK